jgi:hypothetical protein
MLVRYFPKKGKERRFFSLLRRHWPALDAAGLVAKAPARVFRATDKRDGRVHFIEMFEWKDKSASGLAHRTPGVAAIWEPMEPLLEEMQLARIEPVAAPEGKGRKGRGRGRRATTP